MPTATVDASNLAAEARATIVLALPLIAGQVAQMGAGVVETMLAGHLVTGEGGGAGVLAAVAVGNAVWALGFMTLVGVMMAVAPSVAQLDGAGRRGEAAPLFVQAVWLAMALGAGLAAAMFWGGPALAGAIGLDPALQDGVRGFLRAVSFGAPGLGLFFACRGLSDGLSLTRASMVFSAIGLVVLGPLGWALMYGRLGLPPGGAAGAGMAWGIIAWIEGLSFAAWVVGSRRYARTGWARVRLRPDRAAIGGLLRLGVPMAVSVMLEMGLFSAASLAVARFGPAAVAGHQIALSVAALAFMVPLGLSMAVTVRVGRAAGRGDRAGVRRAARAGLLLAVATQTLSCTVMLAAPRRIASLYTSDAAAIASAAGLLLLAALFQMSDGLQVAAAGALRGLKDTRVPMLLTAFSYWGAGMPIGLLCAFAAGLATPGIWIGLVAGLSFSALLLMARLHLRTRPAG